MIALEDPKICSEEEGRSGEGQGHPQGHSEDKG